MKKKILNLNLLDILWIFRRFDFVGRRTVSDDEEEDRYNDILLMMELLTNLLSKDFIDFSDPGL